MTNVRRARASFRRALKERNAQFNVWKKAYRAGNASAGKAAATLKPLQAKLDAAFWKLYDAKGWEVPVRGKPRTYRRPEHIRAALEASCNHPTAYQLSHPYPTSGA